MKKTFPILLLTLTFSFSTLARASHNYYCSEFYQAKLKRIEHHRFIRGLGNVTTSVVVGGAVATGLFATALAIGPAAPGLAVALAFPLSPGLGAVSGITSFKLFDREEGLRQGMGLLSELDISVGDVMELTKERYQRVMLTRRSYDLFDVNEHRQALGLPLLSLAEYLINYPIPAYTGPRDETSIDFILNKMKMHETLDQDWNHFVALYKDAPRDEQFEGLRNLLIQKSVGDEFCPTKKALTLKQIIKKLKV